MKQSRPRPDSPDPRGSDLRGPDLRGPDLKRPTLRHPTLSPRDTQLGYWLRSVSRQLSQALSQKIADQGITVAEWFVLRELYQGERRSSVLAERLGLTRGAMSRLAARLGDHQMIDQQATAWDRRGQMLALTDLGRAVVPIVARLEDENEREFFGNLDPRKREVIVSALREIVRRRGESSLPADPD
jgi:DNA-binding MarR family transcriptional regulator